MIQHVPDDWNVLGQYAAAGGFSWAKEGIGPGFLLKDMNAAEQLAKARNWKRGAGARDRSQDIRFGRAPASHFTDEELGEQ